MRCVNAQSQATVTRLAALPGGWLLASADDDGLLMVTDVRSLGAGLGGENFWCFGGV